MSTSKCRRAKSLHLELPDNTSDEGPPVAAVFLVQFDVKAGYTIAWKKSVAGLDLRESVEFKSLPSGLHNVDEDLVYFTHGKNYAGISAFINRPAAESQRNALMLAVGVLVPLSNGRLGRGWKHAEELKQLAEQLIRDPLQIHLLEDFWQANRTLDDEVLANREAVTESNSQHSPSTERRTRNRAISSASALASPGQHLSLYHPALSLPSLLDTFGPLIYPLYKAALLRKRILLVTQAPVELPCNFVYDISIISNIPSSVAKILPLEPLPTRIQPLFSVGVHDIDALLGEGPQDDNQTIDPADVDPGYGWVACTTDDVLATKQTLFDILVTMPPPRTRMAKDRVWPKIESPRGTENRASQRDLRRYRIFRRDLRRQQSRSRGPSPDTSKNRQVDEEDEQGLLPTENTQETFEDASSTNNQNLIEPPSWSALAYSSFMWWASAGEKGADLDEEVNRDASLFRDLSQYPDLSPTRPKSRRRSAPDIGIIGDNSFILPEMAIIAYFHRLTILILGTLAEIVEAGDKDGGYSDDTEREKVSIGSEDMARMGLDVWSEADRKFVRELIDLYWGRMSEVEGGGVKCCGIRIC